MTDKLEELPIAKVDFEKANQLAEISAIIQDFRSIMEICTRLKSLLSQKSDDHMLLESLWSTVLIKYARCFSSGKRFSLTFEIFKGLNGDPIEAHEYYISMRNKHIAHSVNPFEQIEIGFILSSPREKDKVIKGVIPMSMKHISSSEEGVHQLGMLSNIAQKKLCKQAEDLTEKVLKIGNTMPIEELYKISRPCMVAPGPEKVNKPRS